MNANPCKAIKHPKNIKLVFVLVPILVVGLGMYVFSRLPENKNLRLEGTVEIATTTYYAQVSGTVSDLLVETGQRVLAGDVLAKLDDTAINNEIEQQKAILIMKNAKLNQLKNKPNLAAQEAGRKVALHNVTIAEETLAAAQRKLTQGENDLARGDALFSAGIITQKDLEDLENKVLEMKSALSSATAALAGAKANVESFTPDAENADEVDAAVADIHLTQLALEQLEYRKKDYTLTAQNNGIVVNRTISPMSMVVAGENILELSKEDERYFVFFLPEENSNLLSYGGEITLYPVNGDTQIATATVTFMDWKSVYTPKDFENSSNKNKKSLQVKALIQSDTPIGVGETLELRIQR